MIIIKNKRKIPKDVITEILRHTPENEGIVYKVNFKNGSYSKEKKNRRKLRLITNTQ